MKKLSTGMVLVVLTLLTVQAATAEYRLWTDTKGKTVEGELVQVVGDTVVIKPREGNDLRIKSASLSVADLKYIELSTPPKIEISARKIKEDRSIFARFHRVEEEEVQVTANIRKSSSRPYSGKLMAILLVIAKSERNDDYVVINRTMSPFTFTSENKNTHEFASEKVRLAHSEGGGEFGGEYDGYLVMVMDPDRKMIANEGNRDLFEKIAEDLVGAKKGTSFDKDGNVKEGRGGLDKMKGDLRRPQPPPQKKKGFFGKNKK